MHLVVFMIHVYVFLVSLPPLEYTALLSILVSVQDLRIDIELIINLYTYILSDQRFVTLDNVFQVHNIGQCVSGWYLTL